MNIILKSDLDIDNINEKNNNMFYEFNNRIIELNDKLEKLTITLNDTQKELENIKKICVNQQNQQNKQNKQNKQNRQNKIFRSASLIFIDDELGYLMCNEYRYKEKKNLIHPIGGKVETYDKGLLETAIREFIEETNLEQFPYNNIDKSSKNKLIENIKFIIEDGVKFCDLCVNNELDYYHRYYSFELKKIDQKNHTEQLKDLDEFKKSIIELPKYFNGNFKTEVDNLEWINNNNKINNKIDFGNKKISHLTKMFFNIGVKK